MDISKKSSPAMLGWLPELTIGQQMVVPPPGEVKLKIVITPEGVTIVALSELPNSSNQILEDIGFKKNQIRGMLCG